MFKKHIIALFFLVLITDSKANDVSDIIKHQVVNISLKTNYGLALDRVSGSSGTGGVLDWEQGIIVTNKHVSDISPLAMSEISFYSEDKADLKPLYYDPWNDISFMKFDPKDEKISSRTKRNPIKLNSHNNIAEGEKLFYMGNAGGYGLSSGEFWMSNLFRLDKKDHWELLLRHYHELHLAGGLEGGASGSPIFNKNAEMVGLLNASSQTQSFGIRVDYVRDLFKQLQDGHVPKRGDIQLHLKAVPLTDIQKFYQESSTIMRLYESFSNPSENNHALAIDRVVKGSPLASEEGGQALKSGDLIVGVSSDQYEKINLFGEDIYEFDKFIDQHINSSVNLHVIRNGQEIIKKVTVENAEKGKPLKFARFARAIFHDVSTNLALRFGIERRGVYMSETVYNRSEFGSVGSVYVNENKGVYSGYGKRRVVIYKVNGVVINTLDDFIPILKKVESGELSKLVIVYKDLRNAYYSRYTTEYVHFGEDIEPLKVYNWQYKDDSQSNLWNPKWVEQDV